MSDLRTLHDAFAELERRVDAAATGRAPVVRPQRAVRLVPVAATVVAVAGLVAGAVWLVPGDLGTPAAGPTTALSTTTARNLGTTSPDDLIARFRVVLGDTATVEVTQKFTVPKASPSNQPGSGVIRLDGTDGAPLVGGTLTSAGVTGSFSLMTRPSGSDPGEWCRNSHPAECVVTTLPDGSRLATETARLAPGAVAYMACVNRPDGTTILMKVSNQEDPHGAAINSPGGQFYAPQPPLTLDQMKAIVTSGKW